MKHDSLKWFHQYLDQLKVEITAYLHPDTLWEIEGDVLNSGGNLCTHLLGNLNYFIGAVLGKTGYIRQRDKEFSVKQVPVETLSREIEATKTMLTEVLGNIQDWEADYPPNDYPTTGSIDHQVTRTLAHLAYHLGQVNYHRRLLDR